MASFGFSSFVSSSSHLTRNNIRTTSSSSSFTPSLQWVSKPTHDIRFILCCALQESAVATEKKEVKKAETTTEATAAPAKAKPGAKAPAKPLPEMMEEDVIPSLKSILEANEDISGIELSFEDNKLEGCLTKKDKPYSFWAFFPNGTLTGPKGFSLSSYGSEASSIEPFLVDEKKITAKLVIFWIEKRLAAQGIIPVWKQ